MRLCWETNSRDYVRRGRNSCTGLRSLTRRPHHHVIPAGLSPEAPRSHFPVVSDLFWLRWTCGWLVVRRPVWYGEWETLTDNSVTDRERTKKRKIVSSPLSNRPEEIKRAPRCVIWRVSALSRLINTITTITVSFCSEENTIPCLFVTVQKKDTYTTENPFWRQMTQIDSQMTITGIIRQRAILVFSILYTSYPLRWLRVHTTIVYHL